MMKFANSSVRYIAEIKSPDAAANLYYHFKDCVPRKTTISSFESQAHVLLDKNNVLDTNSTSALIFTGKSRDDDRIYLYKVLLVHVPHGHDSKTAIFASEVNAWQKVVEVKKYCRERNINDADGLIECEVMDSILEGQSELHKDYKWSAIKMKKCENNLRRYPVALSHSQLYQLFRRILKALTIFHTLTGLVHMDVKPENIEFDLDSNCYLVDFGSAVPAHQVIHSCTEYYAPFPLTTKVTLANPAMDIVMLCCSIASLMALDKDDELCNERKKFDANCVLERLNQLSIENFRGEIVNVYQTNLALVMNAIQTLPDRKIEVIELINI